MGNSHFKSNVIAKTGNETIRGFATISATTLTGGTVKATSAMHAESLTATTVNISGVTSIAAGQYIKLGSHQYILFGDMDSQASVEAAATAVDASCRGSLYLGTDGQAWIMTADDTAATISVT